MATLLDMIIYLAEIHCRKKYSKKLQDQSCWVYLMATMDPYLHMDRLDLVKLIPYSEEIKKEAKD
jgi:hypothetical protein